MTGYFEAHPITLKRGVTQFDMLPKPELVALPEFQWQALVVTDKEKFWSLWKRIKPRLWNDDTRCFYFDPVYYKGESLKHYLFMYAFLGYDDASTFYRVQDMVRRWPSVKLEKLGRPLGFDELSHLGLLGVLQSNTILKEGDKVRIKEGPFLGMLGDVFESKNDYVTVQLVIMGKETHVRLPDSYVTLDLN